VKEPAAGDLQDRLVRAIDLSDELARTVVEMAVEYIKTRRPDLADRVDEVLTDDRLSARAARMIARWARRLDPRR
jgi:hypothetical protein